MRLHLGCGNNYRDGFINVDCGNCRVDIYHNLNVIPYPFDEDQFSLIIANQVLEHLDRNKWFDIIRELHRISKPNAIWEFRSPYALSDNFATDPTHQVPLTPRSFDYFDPTKALGKFGSIYRIDTELRVLCGELIPSDRYGPDVYHQLLIVKLDKSGIEIPKKLPEFLYKRENLVKRMARAMVYSIPVLKQLKQGTNNHLANHSSSQQ